MKKAIVLAAAAALALPASVYVLRADPPAAQAPATAPAVNDATGHAIKQAQAEIAKALEWLKTQQQPDHGWAKEGEPPAFTALVLKCFVQAGYDPDTDFIDKGYDNLLEFQKKSGGIYRDATDVYNTAIAISALAAAKGEEEYKEPLKKALQHLKDLQWNDTIQGLPNGEQPVTKDNPNYGGWGYGKGPKGRPDGSNVNLAEDALKDAGLKPDDPAYQAALVFMTRLQNNSETNDQKWAGKDGGFIYSSANGGMSPAGHYTDPDGDVRQRSYGSMTYAGLKSMIYAGLSKDDPRVKAAWGWISKNWTLDINPGLDSDPKHARDGMFYYYHTMARALHAYGQPIIVDAQGKEHDWRLELIAKLGDLQDKTDGHWTGFDKWMEGNSVYTTSTAVLALQEIIDDLKEHPVK